MPVVLPEGVQVDVEGAHVRVKGPKGELERDFRPEMSITLKDDVITVERPSEAPQMRALHGLTRALLNNMVQGVSAGFVKKLEIHGVGFKAAVQGQTITMNLGYSHPIVSRPGQVERRTRPIH